MMRRLPEEIYPTLKSYLLYDDYLCLMNCSKRDFFEIKRKTIYFNLSSKYSMMFVTNEKNFQQQINELVANPTKQISIRISGEREDGKFIAFLKANNCELLISLLKGLAVHRVVCYAEEISFPFLPLVKEVSLFCYFRIKNLALSNLSHLESVELLDFKYLTDISPLRDVPVISLEGCPNLKDFRVLGKQRKLRLKNCHHLEDVRSFAQITELSFSNCPSLGDLSPLNTIPILSFSSCKSITNLSPLLGNHKSLTISYCNYVLEGYEILQNIPIVSLYGCNIKDVGVLKEAKTVTLHDCNDVVDVSVLAGVRKVVLHGNNKIKSLSALVDVPELYLGLAPLVTDAHLLKNRSLTIRYTSSETCNNLLAVSNVHCLEILFVLDMKIVLTAITSCQYLHTVVIEFTNDDFSTKELVQIPILHLQSCHNLTDISGLGRNREVRLSNCRRIRSVSSLRNVPIVMITNCPAIGDYSCLSNVPRLKIL